MSDSDFPGLKGIEADLLRQVIRLRATEMAIFKLLAALADEGKLDPAMGRRLLEMQEAEFLDQCAGFEERSPSFAAWLHQNEPPPLSGDDPHPQTPSPE